MNIERSEQRKTMSAKTMDLWISCSRNLGVKSSAHVLHTLASGPSSSLRFVIERGHSHPYRPCGDRAGAGSWRREGRALCMRAGPTIPSRCSAKLRRRVPRRPDAYSRRSGRNREGGDASSKVVGVDEMMLSEEDEVVHVTQHMRVLT